MILRDFPMRGRSDGLDMVDGNVRRCSSSKYFCRVNSLVGERLGRARTMLVDGIGLDGTVNMKEGDLRALLSARFRSHPFLDV